MQKPTGIIIDPDTDTIGKSDTNPDTQGTLGNTVGIGESKIDGGIPIVEPATIRIGSDTAGRRTSDGRIDGRTRAGRAARSRTSADPQAQTSNLLTGQLGELDFAGVILNIHSMLAAFVHPSLEIDTTEAKKLQDALKRVLAFYPVGIDPKKLAFANLGCVIAEIHGKRIWDLMLHTEKPSEPKPVSEKPPKPQTKPNGAGSVIILPGAGTGGGVGAVDME